MDGLLKKLIDEKFEGNATEWNEAVWGDVELLYTQDNDNWYYQHGDSIYVQAKKGDHAPHCYGCNSKIKFEMKTHSIWHSEFSGPVGGGKVKTKNIPYCPKCEKKPKSSEIIID